MKDRRGIEILPSDFVTYHGQEVINSNRLMVIGLHKKTNLLTLFHEDDSNCHFQEVKVNPADVEVEIQKADPRSGVKKRGKKSWEELQDEKMVLANLEKKKKGELDEWYEPIFEKNIEP